MWCTNHLNNMSLVGGEYLILTPGDASWICSCACCSIVYDWTKACADTPETDHKIF